MAARAMWKGSLLLGKLRLPVKLYAGVQDRKVHFHLLHDKDHVRVEQRMVDPDTDDAVESREVRKGLETEPGVFVVVEEEELDALAPEASRDIELTRFVPSGGIHHQWYERPYWLGPDGDQEGYFALVAALEKGEREGVARWVMRKRPYVGALRVEDGRLMLIALRHADEVVLPGQLEAPGGKALDAKELTLARQLVDALADHFDPAAYHDTYRRAVEELVEAKAKGKRPKLHRPAAKKAPESLEKALAASLARARDGAAAGPAPRSRRKSEATTSTKGKSAKTASHRARRAS
jgi:DNA end-binding protein Ku